MAMILVYEVADRYARKDYVSSYASVSQIYLGCMVL